MPRIINNFRRKNVRKELRRNQTPQEIILWSKLRDSQTTYKWKRQVSIGPYIADFYCWKKLLVLELDGSQHLENKEYDKEREKYFLDLGIKTIRFWNSEVNTNIDGVLKIIMEKLKTQPHPSPLLKGEGKLNSKGHTSIGVQKGSTLLKALSRVEGLKALKQVSMSDKKRPAPYLPLGRDGSGFDELKKQRQDSIISIIKTINGGATIKDIKDKVQVNPKQFPALVSCGEKTLQRELVSMVKNGVLDKTGEKRWSKYFLK